MITISCIETELEKARYGPETPQNIRDYALLCVAHEHMMGRAVRDKDHPMYAMHREHESSKRMDDGPLTKEEAIEWVKSLESEDVSHPEGARYTMEEVRSYASGVDMPTDGRLFMEFWAVMNALYADYCMVARKFNLTDPKFFAEMAKAFINDKDAVGNKAAVYYRCVAK